MIEFGDERMLEPIHKRFREEDCDKWLVERCIEYRQGWKRALGNYIRYGPKDVITSEPPEAFWQRKPSRKVKLRTAEFDEVAKRDDEEHQEESKPLHNICALG